MMYLLKTMAILATLATTTRLLTALVMMTETALASMVLVMAASKTKTAVDSRAAAPVAT
jgi:hypothetical protein